MSPQHTPINPSSLKAHFAHRFLRALKNIKKMNNNRSNIKNSSLKTTPSSKREIYRRSHLIKLASYESMASVVGSRRAWSRAILQKGRNRSRKLRRVVRKGRIKICAGHALRRRRRIGGGERKRNPNPKKDYIDEFGTTAELRKLVPGGESMGTFKLLEETADYVKCLAAQVEVMRTIVNLCYI